MSMTSVDKLVHFMFNKKVTSFPTVPVFTIYCSTGCTCCQDENHWRGPFSTREIANARCAKYREITLLCSQYSRNGNYEIRESVGEVLPDGRIICGNSVYDKFVDDAAPGTDEERIWD